MTRPKPTMTSAPDPELTLDLVEKSSDEIVNLHKLEVELIEQAKEVEKQIHKDLEELKHLQEIENVKIVQVESSSALLTR